MQRNISLSIEIVRQSAQLWGKIDPYVETGYETGQVWGISPPVGNGLLGGTSLVACITNIYGVKSENISRFLSTCAF